ncbi:MAG: hypothetical protein ACLSAF_18695 [Intestinimonas sp.]
MSTTVAGAQPGVLQCDVPAHLALDSVFAEKAALAGGVEHVVHLVDGDEKTDGGGSLGKCDPK